MSVVILVALRDKDENRNFQPSGFRGADENHNVGWKLLFMSLPLEAMRISTDMSQVGVATIFPL